MFLELLQAGMPSAREPVGESTPRAAFQKALAGRQYLHPPTPHTPAEVEGDPRAVSLVAKRNFPYLSTV